MWIILIMEDLCASIIFNDANLSWAHCLLSTIKDVPSLMV